MFAKSLIAAGLLAVGAKAIVISDPVVGQTLYQNASVPLTWTSGPDDPQNFTILMDNEDKSLLTRDPNAPPSTAQLAQLVNTADNFVSIKIDQIREGENFTLLFVNATNTTQVLTEVTQIVVSAGTNSTKPSSTSATSTATSSAVNIPNASAATTKASTDPFASAQAPAATTTGNSALGRVPAAAGAAVMGVLAAALIL